jgi:hypothetical protein
MVVSAAAVRTGRRIRRFYVGMAIAIVAGVRGVAYSVGKTVGRRGSRAARGITFVAR